MTLAASADRQSLSGFDSAALIPSAHDGHVETVRERRRGGRRLG
jgi:hypothetical protein